MLFNTKEPLVKVVVKDNISNRNDGQGKHWSASSKARSRIFNECKDAEYFRYSDRRRVYLPASIKECKIPSRVKVNIVATRVLGPKQRLWDADSILRGEFKQLLDSLVQLGIIEDDGPKFVKHCLGLQDSASRCDGPSFIVEFFEA